MYQFIEKGSITSVPGFLADGIHCGLKRKRKDLAIILSEEPCEAAGTFTLNKVKAAPLVISKNIVKNDQQVKAVLVNSGNANACTGAEGYTNALEVQKYCAKVFGFKPHEVLISSTGVIGQQLDVDLVKDGITALDPHSTASAGQSAANAIMTTDKSSKSYAVKAKLSTGEVTIGGIAKGSGMIMPNMATMLAFIGTDAKIEKPVLQGFLSKAVNDSFNKISVDGDTSTNDMVVLLSNGMSGIEVTAESDDYKIFLEALTAVCKEMAKAIVKDGEGATKLISVIVQKAKNAIEADKAAKAVVNSPLVKTAVNGADANWGRILSAVGNSGVTFSPEKTTIAIGGLILLQPGFTALFNEDEAKSILSQNEIEITIDLAEGDHSTNWWTCDFSQEYVKINASYRT